MSAPVALERRHVYQLAAEADCDPRTVRALLGGRLSLRVSRAATRIVAAMRRLGWESLLRRLERGEDVRQLGLFR